MANVTRIKAGDAALGGDDGSRADAKKGKTTDRNEAKLVQVSGIFAPFRYVRDSWREIRQVRWPDRKTTWKMTLSVVIYVAIFGAVIMLLDALFTFIFNLILGE